MSWYFDGGGDGIDRSPSVGVVAGTISGAVVVAIAAALAEAGVPMARLSSAYVR